MTGADGFTVFDSDPRTAEWAHSALVAARQITAQPEWRKPDNLRHGRTWFVGVDALPNGIDGSIGGVPLRGPWQAYVPELPLHKAQLSVIYEGYPQQDSDESDANHRFRVKRAAAHVDGLLSVGPARRRFAREYHAYILSLPLNDMDASPTVVWRGSQRIMQDALRRACEGQDPAQVDITEVYAAARKRVFAECEEVALNLSPGQSALLHPFVLHGTRPWAHERDPSGDGRIIAFFRPECRGGAAEWLAMP